MVGVAVLVGVPVREAVFVRVPEGDFVCEGVPLGESVCVRERDTLPDTLGVPLRVRVALGDADALRRLSTLSPRYVRLAMAASAPPPTPAASHSSADSRSPLTMVLDGTSCVTLAYRRHTDGADSQRRAGSCRTNA